MPFKNCSRPLKAGEKSCIRSDGRYTYDHPSPYLYVWNNLFQALVSQAATMLLTGKYHDKQCGIYKCEGGCNVPGVNGLVLNSDCCYWDWDRNGDKKLTKQLREVADMISHIVLGWNPNDPINSMLSLAVEFVNENSKIPTTVTALDQALRGACNSGPFGGNALSAFFNHNPFSKFPTDRKYLRFCLTKFNEPNLTDAQVDQHFADADLSDALLKEIEEAEQQAFSYIRTLSCSPRRSTDELRFWLNGIIYGWFTEAQVRVYIKLVRGGSTKEELKDEFVHQSARSRIEADVMESK